MADIILKNDRLKVVISEPGTLYKRQRFDWCGVVTSVELDRKHSYLSREPMFYNQITGGHGLSSNFEAANGFEYGNTPIGDYFPRIGVGRIIRHDRSPLSMYHDYTIDPAPMRYEAEEDKVVFYQEPIECNGYAYGIKKTLRLIENQLETEYQLTNVGEKFVMLEESNHNYTMIDNMPINADYELSVPYNIKLKMGRGKVTLGYHTLSVAEFDDFFIFDIEGYDGCLPHTWTVTHKPTGLGYSETVKTPLSKFFVWGCHNNFCPIVYVKIACVPGQTTTWTRTLKFF